MLQTNDQRNEILSNCADEDERRRTEELIRPILRGRDISRYGYNWANLWLIATFPARKYDIEQFPAVKSYLLSFAEPILRDAGFSWVAENHLADYCCQKLSQTGRYIEISGQRIRLGTEDEKARKKTLNKWFETQDSISYWDDFSKPKILYPDIMRLPKRIEKMDSYPYFVIDNHNMIPEATLFMMTGNDIESIFLFLCSEIGFFAFSKFYMGPVFDDTGFRYKKEYLVTLPVPHLQCESSLYSEKLATMLNLSPEEISHINSYKKRLI